MFDKPEEYYTLDKLRKAAAVDRRMTIREILEKVFDLIPDFKSKDELCWRRSSTSLSQTTSRIGLRGHNSHQELLQGIRHHRRLPVT